MNGDTKKDEAQVEDDQPADPKKVKEAVKHAEQRRGTKRGEDISEKEPEDAEK